MMTLPAALWIFLFKYITLVGLGIAFLDYKPRRGILESAFVGIENFVFLFKTEIALRATRNTVLLNLLFIFVGLVFALFVANLLFLIYKSAMRKYYQAILLLPNFISFVIVSYFVFALLANENGMLNMLFESHGLETIDWYSSPQYWPVILLIARLWNSMGWSSLIYLAGMLAIDPQMYEASRIDGAGRWVQFRYITFPMILPIVVINLLLSLGHIFSADFGLFFLLTRNQAKLYPTTDVLDTFIYRALTGLGDLGMASAAQFYQSIVGFVLILFANYVVRRLSEKDNDLSFF